MSAPEPAAKRFWILQLVRLSGVGLVLLGMAGFANRLGLNEAQGIVLIVGGFVAFFGFPVLLTKHWKTRE